MTNSQPPISSEVYDRLKWVTLYVLPAVGTFYFALSGIWGFPYGEEVTGTITALILLLSTVLGISKAGYNRSEARFDGNLVVKEGQSGLVVEQIEADIPLGQTLDRGEITLKVKTPDESASQ